MPEGLTGNTHRPPRFTAQILEAKRPALSGGNRHHVEGMKNDQQC